MQFSGKLMKEENLRGKINILNGHFIGMGLMQLKRNKSEIDFFI